VQVRIVEETKVGDTLDAAIKDTLVKCFPHNEPVFSKARRWRGNTPLYNAVVYDKGLALGNIAVVDRTIKVGEGFLRIAGVGNVCVLPKHRGTGISDAMLKAVMDEAGKRQFEFGFLFTTEPIKKVYARNGWIEIEDLIVVRVENGREIVMPPESVHMYYPLMRKKFPPGNVHLYGDKW
jgi:GNAT superfamily N-acetyltransferase